MALSKQPYKGTRDFYPEDKRLQKWLFSRMRETVERFGYQEYDAPLIEPLEMYMAKTGDEIVNEQTYSFTDRGGREVVIRPEMTPSVSRLVAARRQELAYPLRLYNIGTRWRYEQPQRGRTREFWQLDVDLFGVEGIEGDVEVIQVADAILKSIGARPEMYEIRIGSRKLFAELCNDYLGINEEMTKSLSRVIDKIPKLNRDELEVELKGILNANTEQDKIENVLDYFFSSGWDSLPYDFTRSKGIKELQRVLRLLAISGIQNVKFSPSVVRGLDYYTDIVFEIFDKSPENNRSMFGGGRYDGLVGMFGVEPVPTVGFAMGDVTLANFLESNNLLPNLEPETQVVAILVGDVYEAAQKTLGELRDKGINIAVDATNRKLDAKIKSAVKSGAKYALFIGKDELATGSLKLKNLQTGEERTVTLAEVPSSML